MEICVEDYDAIKSETESMTVQEAKPERLWRYTKNFMKKIVAFLFSHIGLTCTVVVYAMFGGVVFQATEAPNEREVRQLVTHTKQLYVDKFMRLLNDSTTEDIFRKTVWLQNVDAILRDFKNEIHEVTEDRNWDGKFGDEDYQWTFADSLLYSVTVITTIGYGHIAPRTTGGKLLTIVYAIAGIPLTMLCLRNIGNLMAVIFRIVYRQTCVNLTYQYIRLKRRRLKQKAFHKLRERGVLLKRWANKKRLSLSVRAGFDTRDHVDSVTDSEEKLSITRKTASRYREHCNDGFVPEITTPSYRSRSMSVGPSYLAQMTTIGERNSLYGSAEFIEHLDRRSMSQLRNNRKYRPIRSNRARRNTLSAIQELETFDQHNADTADISDSFSGSEPTVTAESSQRYTEGLDRVSSASMRCSLLSLGDFDKEDLILKNRLKTTREMVPISVCLLLMTGYMILGAMMFSPWEKWDFMTGFYFCFVTLTSIGFGDIVPGAGATDWDSDEKGVLIVLYLLFGMSLLAMSFHLIQEEVKHKCRKIGIKIGLLEDRLNKMLDKLGENV